MSTSKTSVTPMENQEACKLSIIIVNYNTKHLLMQCLVSILETTKDLSFEIIVVDNNSTDESVKEVRTHFPMVKLIDNKTNRGFAAGSNQGLKMMRGEYALLLNPDTVVLNDALNKMIKFMENHPNVGITGCKILTSNNSLQRAAFPPPTLIRTIISQLSLERLSTAKSKKRLYVRHLDRFFPASFSGRYYDHLCKTSHKPFKVGWVSGACLMIKKKTIEDIGFLDENIFLFGEDVDWCCRAKEKNWGVAHFPHAQIIHYGGESTSGNLSITIGSSHYSRLYFAKKHFGRFALLILKLISFFELTAKWLIVSRFLKIDPKERRARLNGYKQAFKLIFRKIS